MPTFQRPGLRARVSQHLVAWAHLQVQVLVHKRLEGLLKCVLGHP